MVWVFPGVWDILANPVCPVSMFMRLDLPTFDRPIKANSGLPLVGHWANEVTDCTNSAERMIIFFVLFLLVVNEHFQYGGIVLQ